MKTLMLYYSLSGKTKKLAEYVSKKLRCDVEEIKRKDEIGAKSLFMQIVTISFEMLIGKKPKLKPMKSDISKYDKIIIGTPLWAGNLSTPIRAFLKAYGSDMKDVAFFCTKGGDDSKIMKITDSFESLTNDASAVLGVSENQLNDNSYKKMADSFIKDVNK